MNLYKIWSPSPRQDILKKSIPFGFSIVSHQHIGEEQRWLVIHYSLSGLSAEYFNSVLTVKNTLPEYSTLKSNNYNVCLWADFFFHSL